MRSLLTLLASVCSSSALGAPPYQMQRVMLLQPEFVLSNRLGSPEDLANYIKAVNAAAESAVSSTTPRSPGAGFIVLAVRPGGTSKVWIDLSPKLPYVFEGKLRDSLEAVTPFSARNGVVVFAINVSLWGAAPTSQRGPHVAEWELAVKRAGMPLEVGDIVDRVWPAKRGP